MIDAQTVILGRVWNPNAARAAASLLLVSSSFMKRDAANYLGTPVAE